MAILTFRGYAPGLALLVGLSALPAAGIDSSRPPKGEPTESREDIAEGEFLYQTYCQSCHGKTAMGDGPVASELKTPPADLTRIRQRNDGEFPSERIYRRIDGRSAVAAHGPSEMPVWGFAFQQLDSDANQESAVREKILLLVDYLESIQIPQEPRPVRPRGEP